MLSIHQILSGCVPILPYVPCVASGQQKRHSNLARACLSKRHAMNTSVRISSSVKHNKCVRKARTERKPINATRGMLVAYLYSANFCRRQILHSTRFRSRNGSIPNSFRVAQIIHRIPLVLEFFRDSLLRFAMSGSNTTPKTQKRPAQRSTRLTSNMT